MREGKYERELRELEKKPESIHRGLRATRARGRQMRTYEKKLRKAKARFEVARRACLDLPKSWRDYKAHGKIRDRYANPKVQAIHDANKKLSWAYDGLKNAVKSFNTRHADRKELKALLRKLPDLIESAKQLAEIEARKKVAKKPKPEKDWKSKWQEVAPGLVVPANTVKAYIKTFPKQIPFNNYTVQVSNDAVFTLRPMQNPNVYLKLPCVTWEQAERMRV